MQKRGQVTIWIIVGVLVLSALALLTSLQRDVAFEEPEAVDFGEVEGISMIA